MANLNLLAFRDNIEEAFKSLIQSGRPDIRDEENNDLIPKLYVDLFENNYSKEAIKNKLIEVLNCED